MVDSGAVVQCLAVEGSIPSIHSLTAACNSSSKSPLSPDFDGHFVHKVLTLADKQSHTIP